MNKTNIFMCAVLMLSMFSLASATQANEVDLRISDDTVHANYMVDGENADLRYGVGYLYKDVSSSSANVLNLDLHAKGQTALANLPTSVAVGFQINALKAGDLKGTGLGIGGVIRTNLPDTPGLSVEAGAHYAPKVLSFQDIDEFRRLHLQVNYRVIPAAEVFAGYHYLNVGIDGTDNSTLESGGFVGLRLNF